MIFANHECAVLRKKLDYNKASNKTSIIQRNNGCIAVRYPGHFNKFHSTGSNKFHLHR